MGKKNHGKSFKLDDGTEVEIPMLLRRLYLTPRELANGAGLLALFLLLYGALYLCIGKPFLPGGPAWAVMLIWVVSISGGWAADRITGIPAPLGMLGAGMLLANINSADAIRGLPSSWSKEIRASALAFIFLRSGLELDLRIFKTCGWPAVRLLLIPGLIEAFYDGSVAHALFDMPWMLSFALGFILKAVGPALVIQMMFETQQKRLGVAKGIPAMIVAAASCDDMVAITGYTLFVNLAVHSGGDTAYPISRGPLSVLLGIMGGLLMALVCSATIIWNNRYKRTAIVLFSVLGMKFFFDKFHFDSGGALGALTLGLTIKELWARGMPGLLSSGEKGTELAHHVEKKVRFIWNFVMMPLLFGLVGSSIRFRTLSSGVIPKACVIVITGLVLRMCCSYVLMYGGHFNWRERLFIAFAWTPKATVQAALGALPLDMIRKTYSGKPEYDQQVDYGENILTTAVFCIIICGIIGTLLVRIFGPILLERAEEVGGDKMTLQSPKSTTDFLTNEKEPSENGNTSGEEARDESSVVMMEDYDHEQEMLRMHNTSVAAHIESIEALATSLERQDEETSPTPGQASIQLRAAVRALRRRLLEDSVNMDEVEGAEDFVRATSMSTTLRHRHPPPTVEIPAVRPQ